MPLTFASIDDALIERVFQPLSDFISNSLGLNRSRAATICIELSALAWSLSQAPDLSDAVLAWQAGPAFIHLILLLIGLTALLSLKRLFRHVGGSAANPLRPRMRPHRAVILMLLSVRLIGLQGMDLAAAADLIMLCLTTLALYLGACAAPPPIRRALGLPQAI